MIQHKILWADDEIDLLKPHILFLEKKGYDVTPVNSGADALEKVEEQVFDVIFLDENMPGMTGLEALAEINKTHPNTPVVMITKSEEEDIMEEAIGAKIADYLIKPLNPNQILLSLKKILQHRRIVSEKTNQSYQQEFQKISMAFSERLDFKDWVEIYQKLVYWDLEINQTENRSMSEVLDMQKTEANVEFIKFIKQNYEDWIGDLEDEDTPVMSHNLFLKKVFPLITDTQEESPLFVILVDNLRYDQWKTIESMISPYFNVKSEEPFYSILPTTTAYARNAIFSGLTPLEISQKHPEYWINDDQEGGKNNFEEELLAAQMKRYGLKQKMSYHKVIQAKESKQVLDNLRNLMHNDLNVIVYNFVDMLSHARTDTNMVRELAPDEAAYRSLTKSWFEHSSLLETLKQLSNLKARVVITTDHGTVLTKNPYRIIGDKNTNTNLRYKQGKNLSYEKKNVFATSKPEAFGLPKVNVSSQYVFATENYFFAYPNNYNYYVSYYKDTFQHGGLSLDEVIIPFAVLEPKST